MTGLSRSPSRWLPGRLRWSRRTVRMRLTILYAALFLASGTVLIAITSVLAATDNPPLQEYGEGPASGPAQRAGIAVPGFLRQFLASGYAQEVQQHAAVQRELLTQSLIALAVMSVISAGLGWLVAGRFLRPLRTITATARRVSASSLNERLALAGPDDELKELADTFDGLLSRLEQSFEAQRRFVANASHELRTPVTRQRAMAEVALGDQSPTVESLRDACTGVLEASIEHAEPAPVRCPAQHRRYPPTPPWDLPAPAPSKSPPDGSPPPRRRPCSWRARCGSVAPPTPATRRDQPGGGIFLGALSHFRWWLDVTL